MDETIVFKSKILDRLIKTYDTKFLDNEDPALVNELYTDIYALPERKVLHQLIDNYQKKQDLQPDFIGGPSNLSCHWNEKYNKMIYIFGEKHSTETDCDIFKGAETSLSGLKMNIEDVILKLYSTTPSFFEFYFETRPYARKQKKYSDDYFINQIRQTVDRGTSLREIHKKFLKCIPFDGRNDPICKLARTHYFDVRTIEYNKVILSQYETYMPHITYILDIYHESFDYFDHKTKMKDEYSKKLESASSDDKKQLTAEYNALDKEYTDKIFLELDKSTGEYYINLINTENSVEIANFFKDQVYKNIYVINELAKLESTSPVIARTLRKYINDKITKKVNYEIDSLKRYARIILDKTTDNNSYLLHYFLLFRDFVNLTVFAADIYVLARIFKSHDITRSAYEGARKQDQPQNSHNIIIYAGNTHSIIYRDFLSYIGFDEIFFIGNKGYNNTCIDMRQHKEPFFSQEVINKYNQQKRLQKIEELRIALKPYQQMVTVKILSSILPRLVRTYDTKFLDNMNPTLVNELYSYVRQLSEQFPERKVLFQLIENHEKQEKPQPDFIVGPSNLSCHWSKKYNKMIYIFGDNNIHREERECNLFTGGEITPSGLKMRIEDFMLELYKTTDCFFEFHVQRNENETSGAGTDFNLNEINKKFSKCINYEQSQNQDCKLTRTHYFESTEIEFDRNSKFGSTVSNILEQYKNYENYKKKLTYDHMKAIRQGNLQEEELEEATLIFNQEKLTASEKLMYRCIKEGPHQMYPHQIYGIVKEELYDLFESDPPNRDAICRYFQDVIYENIYVIHELSRVDEVIADKIREYINKHINRMIERYLFMWKSFIEFVNPRDIIRIKRMEANPDEYIQKFHELFNDFRSIIVRNVTDVYMIARMFKVYNIERLADQPHKVHNIIIYANRQRSDTYRNFLKYIGFDMISSTPSLNFYENFNSCLDMRNFPMPFFSQSHLT